jgi:hypothetical protein
MSVCIGHKLKRDGSIKLLRSLSVAAVYALNDENVESEDDMNEGNSKSQVEEDRTRVQHVERFPRLKLSTFLIIKFLQFTILRAENILLLAYHSV